MGLNRVRLGELLEHSDLRNVENDFDVNDVRGMSVAKEFIPTKADMRGVALSNYKIVRPGWFSYVTITSRNSGKLTLAYNDSLSTYLVSSSYEVFYLENNELLDSRYLFMLINRSEYDRFSRFNSWGSAREVFSWEDLCSTEISLPPIEIQRKYVAIYEAMLANQQVYEQGIDNLKLACDSLIERLMGELPLKEIGPYIEQSDLRNEGSLGRDAVRGLSITKTLIGTKAKLDGVSLNNYKVVAPGNIAYVPVTSRNGDKISIAINDSDDAYITSAINTVFRVKPDARDKLLPAYLMLFFNRTEFDRYARFNSWGSARETFDWGEMCDVRIPIPELSVQRYAVALYNARNSRASINGRLKQQLKDICPILIRGSIEEASR